MNTSLLHQPVLILEHQYAVLPFKERMHCSVPIRILNTQGDQVGYIREHRADKISPSTHQLSPSTYNGKWRIYDMNDDHILTIVRSIQKDGTHITQLYTRKYIFMGSVRRKHHRSHWIYEMFAREANPPPYEDKPNTANGPLAGGPDTIFSVIDEKNSSKQLRARDLFRGSETIASISKNTVKFSIDSLNNDGYYVLNFQPIGSSTIMNNSQRAVLLGTALSIDLDKFSKAAYEEQQRTLSSSSQPLRANQPTHPLPPVIVQQRPATKPSSALKPAGYVALVAAALLI